MGIFDWLVGKKCSGGNGSCAEQAIVVNSVGEEYEWIGRHCRGFQPMGQSLMEINGKPYDVLLLQNGKGEKREVYFDISKFYGQM